MKNRYDFGIPCDLCSQFLAQFVHGDAAICVECRLEILIEVNKDLLGSVSDCLKGIGKIQTLYEKALLDERADNLKTFSDLAEEFRVWLETIENPDRKSCLNFVLSNLEKMSPADLKKVAKKINERLEVMKSE